MLPASDATTVTRGALRPHRTLRTSRRPVLMLGHAVLETAQWKRFAVVMAAVRERGLKRGLMSCMHKHRLDCIGLGHVLNSALAFNHRRLVRVRHDIP